MSNVVTPLQPTLAPFGPFHTGGAVTIDRPPARAFLDVYTRASHVVSDTRQLLAEVDIARGPRSPAAKMFDSLRSGLDKVGRTGFVGGWLVMFGGVSAYPHSDPGYYFLFGGIAGLFASVGCLHASLHSLPFEKKSIAHGIKTKAAEVVEKLRAHVDALGAEERIVLGPILTTAIERQAALPVDDKVKLIAPLTQEKPSVVVDDVYRRAQKVAELADALRTDRVYHHHLTDLTATLTAASDGEREVVNTVLAEPLAKSPSPLRDTIRTMLAPPSAG